MNRRQFLKGAAASALLARIARGQEARREKSLHVMDTWFWQEKELDLPAQAALLKKLGYAGLALSWGQKHAERLKALQGAGLEMPGIFVTADVDGAAPRELVPFLKGTGGLVWLALGSRKHKRSDPAGDEAAALMIAKLADECGAAGLPGVALYPHAGLWLERVGDAVRLADRLRRPDVGVMFNQFHWMAAEPGRDLRATLEAARHHLRSVSINGSANRATIQPLGEGEYDLLPLLRLLRELKYAGPISHQGFGIQGRLPEKLEASMKAWEGLKNRLAAPAEIVRAHVFISGVVQGVSFRASTQGEAEARGVVGWVRNLDDGRVEAVLQGPRDRVEGLLQWCRKGPPAAKVEKLETAWEAVAEDFKSFTVR